MTPTLDEETIEWRSVADPPDADTTVLVYCPTDAEPVWFGWYDAGVWFSVDAQEYEAGIVVAWGEMPAGPER